MHPLDIPMAVSGGPFRPMRGAPGLLGPLMCKLFYHPDERLEPVAIDQPLTAEEILPIAGGFDVIHTPGHCAGQVALLWRPGRMLFAGDVCTNVMGLGDPVGFENLNDGRASQRKLASLSFDAAGFGHGARHQRGSATSGARASSMNVVKKLHSSGAERSRVVPFLLPTSAQISSKSPRRVGHSRGYKARMNATRSCFSCAVSLSPRTRLKNSTVSSSVSSRSSCR
jgi:glyoxylase-like metal-dependent hydrolase (beta-lactamase superfamily II)